MRRKQHVRRQRRRQCKFHVLLFKRTQEYKLPRYGSICFKTIAKELSSLHWYLQNVRVLRIERYRLPWIFSSYTLLFPSHNVGDVSHINLINYIFALTIFYAPTLVQSTITGLNIYQDHYGTTWQTLEHCKDNIGHVILY